MPERVALEIMDCTLRDGSYVIDYRFTAQHVRTITAALEDAGCKWIEVGHGLGLNASSCGKGTAAETDSAYLEAAADVLTEARFGAFFIPGIGRLEDLDMAAGLGASFIRCGTNVTEVEESAKYIRHAKELGLRVWSNLMKSYAVSPEKCAEQARKAAAYGADAVVVVDSAGCMLPAEVRQHVRAVADVSGLPVGFHGHNNLQLAMANALAAVDAGATHLDGTLRGMGRSAGNVQLEVLVAILGKLGYDTGMDLKKLLDVGSNSIVPLMRRSQGVDAWATVVGLARFHSGFTQIVRESAAKHRIDPRDLILCLSKVELIEVTPEIADRVAQECLAEQRNL